LRLGAWPRPLKEAEKEGGHCSFSGTAVIIAFRVEQLNKEFNSGFLITKKVNNSIDTRNGKLEPLGFKSLKGLYREIEFYRVR
jgi:hypothetical protein